jgi:hypothetical protein
MQQRARVRYRLGMGPHKRSSVAFAWQNERSSRLEEQALSPFWRRLDGSSGGHYALSAGARRRPRSVQNTPSSGAKATSPRSFEPCCRQFVRM